MSGATVPLLDLAREHDELGDGIRAAIERVMRSSAFVGGAEVAAFEAEFAAYCGVRHAIGVANGTDALVLALRALGVGAGDAVLTPPFTFLASVEAIDLVGAMPVFADIDLADYNLDVEAAAAVLRRQRVKAVIAVDLYGQPARMQEIVELAHRHDAAVVEDAAQAQGARLLVDGAWKRAGALGDVATFSFYPTKNLGALGDAGAITTDRDDLAERVRLLHDHGQAEKYRHVLRGCTNSRLDGLQAAVLRLKLGHLDRWNRRRRELAASYFDGLRNLPLVLPTPRHEAEPVYHQFVVRLANRAAVQEKLRARGVSTAIHYPFPIHLQEAYRELGLGPGSFPQSERAAGEVLSLPLFPRLQEGELEQVVAALKDAL